MILNWFSSNEIQNVLWVPVAKLLVWNSFLINTKFSDESFRNSFSNQKVYSDLFQKTFWITFYTERLKFNSIHSDLIRDTSPNISELNFQSESIRINPNRINSNHLSKPNQFQSFRLRIHSNWFELKIQFRIDPDQFRLILNWFSSNEIQNVLWIPLAKLLVWISFLINTKFSDSFRNSFSNQKVYSHLIQKTFWISFDSKRLKSIRHNPLQFE